VELKEYELQKLKKKSKSNVALQPMLKVVAGKKAKTESKKPAPAKKSATNKSATNKSATKKTTPASR
jgi:hypothetical protein